MFERPRPPLSIHSTPFKPTYLSIPPSPFTPLTPLPQSKPSPPPSTATTIHQTTSAPSPQLSWMWQCHHCLRTYPLAATRRCLDDGHAFCSGTTKLKTWRAPLSKRTKRHKACASEFDYSGWKAFGRWRRGGQGTRAKKARNSNVDGAKKNCWNHCDYPSECRWGTRFGVHTPLSPEFPDPVPLPLAQADAVAAVDPNYTQLHPPRSLAEKNDFWGTLIASAKRRRSVGSSSSPLANSVPSSADVAALPAQTVDHDGDTDMATPPSSSTAGSVAMDMLKDLMRRKSSRKGRDKGYVGPMLTVAKTVVMKHEEGIGGADPEVLVNEDGGVDDDGFSPLERVPSRQSDGV
ncbi:hypothetical protein BDU57DRAFT_496837 [Ampelomyces quisqualis]|uniref:Uncharacterized protein n=1 Tax=Ampelomyces quisqualis TaxID=50730 RepID=A0A6A5QND7_AMPQU|nr:hypothetical protein BDU57DRAFT_496837 [Ampelomyces quisqualis]